MVRMYVVCMRRMSSILLLYFWTSSLLIKKYLLLEKFLIMTYIGILFYISYFQYILLAGGIRLFADKETVTNSRMSDL